MRKTRLKILPAHCLAHIGFLLLYLSCPILADTSRGQPDRGLPSAYQLQVLEHCASPPEDPGDGGCSNYRNAHMKMTWPHSPDNEHKATCSILEVFNMENTCSMAQQSTENSDGHPKPTIRYARRLLAARSKDQQSPDLKIQAPRQVKYRSLKRPQVHEENVNAERQLVTARRTSTRNNFDMRLSRVSERRDGSTERDSARRASERVSRRISDVDIARRITRENQSPSRVDSERRNVLERDISRRMTLERQSSRKSSIERRSSDDDYSRKLHAELHNSRKVPVEYRLSELQTYRRISPERHSTRRASLERRSSEHDGIRLANERQTRTFSADRRNVELRSLSADRQSVRNLPTERKVTEFDTSRRISTERQYSRTQSSEVSGSRSSSTNPADLSFNEFRFSRRRSTERISDRRYNSRASSESKHFDSKSTRRQSSKGNSELRTLSPSSAERRLAEIRSSNNFSSNRHQAEIRVLSLKNRRSTERLNSERLPSNKILVGERRVLVEKSHRRNSIDEPHNSEEDV